MRQFQLLLSILMGSGFAFADEGPNFEKLETAALFQEREVKRLPALYFEGPRFGPEFTFARLGSHASLAAVAGRMHAHLLDGQKDGAKFKMPAIYLFESPNGWAFEATEDPGVVEVKMTPMTVGDFARFKNDIHDAVFTSAANTGHFPALYLGGGHINIDLNYFLERPPILVRNFLVDWVNHSELSMGILGYNTNSAMSYSASPIAQRAFAAVADQFDRGEFGSPYVSDAGTVRRFINALGTALYRCDAKFRELWGEASCSSGKCEISLVKPIEGERARLEIRVVRPQASMDVWLNQIHLIRDRIRFLEQGPQTPVAFAPHFVLAEDADIAQYMLNPPMPAQMALRHFYEFVVETGHRWKDHRDYIWPQWFSRQEATPEDPSELEKFEASQWFRERQCRALLIQGK